MSEPHSIPSRDPRRLGVTQETGAVIVVVMMFVMVFLIVGLSLYFLVASQTRATETERTDVKSFNVAEAGVDAGMLALKLGWPVKDTDSVTLDLELLKSTLQGDPSLSGLWDPRNPVEFIQVDVYDNVDASGNTTWIPNMDPATRVYWDSNDMGGGVFGDNMMFVDATANVDNDRHRILILAEQNVWQLKFPLDMALCAGDVDQQGAKALGLAIEDGPPASYYVEDPAGWDEVTWDDDYTFTMSGSPGLFDQVLNDAMMNALVGIANEQGCYYTDDDPAEAFLRSGDANGKVVYIDINDGSAVDISANLHDHTIGTEEQPVVVVIDTRDSPATDTIGWDMTGNAEFYGILITLGDAQLKGTCSNHGAVYCEGLLSSNGQGKYEEIYYNLKVIQNINRKYTLSVSIVPNTWEEYTLPRDETPTTTAP
ncbi:MAG: hypothetical protein JXA87_09400 [Thermoleophilia bacterium]|nr:hypothetical protein [Thermoleophilia bacterium]